LFLAVVRNGEKIDVLVADDNPDDSELTIQAVKRGNKNATIIHLRNGEEVLHYLRNAIKQKSCNIRLIMLNLGMPKIDGFEVLRKLREIEETKFTPIVILTALEDESKISKAYKLGANSYVVKPTRYESYMEKVSSLAFYWSMVNTWTI
jgi:two-component system response regulator